MSRTVQRSQDDIKWTGYAKKTYTPLFEGIAIQILPKEQKHGEIYLPETVRHEKLGRLIEAIVIACGPLVRYLRIGQKIIIGNTPMMSGTHDGEHEICVTTESMHTGVVDELEQSVIERAKEICGENYEVEMAIESKRLSHFQKVEDSREVTFTSESKLVAPRSL